MATATKVKPRKKTKNKVFTPKLSEEQRLIMQAIDSYAMAKHMAAEAKKEMDRWRPILEELGIGTFEGHQFRVVINRGVRRQLDMKALAKEIGEDVLDEFRREVEFTRIDVYEK